MQPTIYIFDLGGVLINLNVSRCMHAFEELMGEENVRLILGMDSNGEGRRVSADEPPVNNVVAVSIATKQLMADFERGLIATDEFINQVLRYCRPGTTEEQVKEAWFAMLDDLPKERLEVVDKLRAQGHPVYLLSNGNDLHFDFINQTYGLSRHFDGLFLSQKMHLSKPEKAIFETVQNAIGGKGRNIIFIDDLEANRLAAEQYAGWQTFSSIDDFLKKKTSHL